MRTYVQFDRPVWLIAVVMIHLLLVTAVFLIVGERSMPTGNEQQYINLGYNIAKYGAMRYYADAEYVEAFTVNGQVHVEGVPVGQPSEPVAERTPIYPLWFALLYRLFGLDLTAFRMANVLISIGVLGALFLALRAVEPPDWTKAVTLLVAATDLRLAAYSGVFVEEHLTLLFVLWAIFTTLVALRTQAKTWLALVGLMLACIVLTRPYFALAVGGWLIWLALRFVQSRRWAAVLALILPFALLMGLWTLRNVVSVGQPVVLATLFEENFAKGNNPLTLDTVLGRSGLEYNETDDSLFTRAELEAARAAGGDKAERALRWQRAWAYRSSHWQEVFYLYPLKAIIALSPFEARRGQMLWYYGFIHAFVLVLSFVGLVHLWQKQRFSSLVMMALFLWGTCLLNSMLFHYGYRFAFPIRGIIWPSFAYGLAALGSRIGSGQRRVLTSEGR